MLKKYMGHREIVVEVHNLSKIFVNKSIFSASEQVTRAVDNVSFTVHEGEIVGLLGPNGAGKTTIMQMLMGTLKPTSGSICYFGKNLEYNRSEIIQQLAFASNTMQMPSTLTVMQNLDIYARLYGLSRSERQKKIEELLTIFGMWQSRFWSVGQLSYGQAARLNLVKAFLSQPRIVLFDEATAALDPEISKELKTFLMNQRTVHKTSFVIVSHNMVEVAELCDRVLIIKEGVLVADDKPSLLLQELTKSWAIFSAPSYESMITYCAHNELVFKKENNQIMVELEEKAIASFVQQLVHNNIGFTNFSIKKPTLEDYFLKIATTNTTISKGMAPCR